MGLMVAVVQHGYGEARDVLTVEKVPMPRGGPHDLLVRVHASAVSPGDLFMTRGSPYLFRLMTGVTRPRHGLLGLVVAGTVVEAGGEGFAPGDEVFAEIARGGFAEYAVVPARVAAPKPASLTFEEAAAVPLVGVTALQALRDVAKVEPGQRVLVNGASGGVGTYAVQVAKVLGAHVTAVCSTANADLVTSLGADAVIDYTRLDLTHVREQWDVVLDNVGTHSLAQLRRLVRRGGVLVPSANTDGRWLGGAGRALHALAVSPFVPQRLRPFVARSRARDLVALSELIEAGAITPVVDRTYPLAEAAVAIDYYGCGHARGKVVITV